MRYISGTKLDERIVRCDLDAGYKDTRQFGRGKSGGQVRDEHREDYDPGRGGWGAQAQRLEAERRKEVEDRYADTTGIVAGGGGDWRQGEVAIQSLKRGRSPDDDGEQERVSMQFSYLIPWLTLLRRLPALAWMWRIACETLPCKVSECSLGRHEWRRAADQMIIFASKVFLPYAPWLSWLERVTVTQLSQGREFKPLRGR